MSKNLKVFNVVVLVVVLAAVSAMADTATGSFERTLKVSGKADVSVETGSGSIVVKAGETSDVHIYAKIRARDSNGSWSGGGLSAEEKVKRLEANPPIRQEGNRIIIGKIEDRDLRNNVSISYEINVPAETQLVSHTGSGEQKIYGIEGPVEAETGSGGMTIHHIGGNLKAVTGSGDVDIEAIKGKLIVKTGSGHVKAFGVNGSFDGETGSGGIEMEQSGNGDVTAHSGSGDLRLRNVRGGMKATTGSGDIEAAGELLNGWRLHTGSGSVSVRLPQNANFELDASTGSGGVNTSHPVTIQGSMNRHRMQGKVGNGGPMLSVETGSGTIHID